MWSLIKMSFSDVSKSRGCFYEIWSRAKSFQEISKLAAVSYSAKRKSGGILTSFLYASAKN